MIVAEQTRLAQLNDKELRRLACRLLATPIAGVGARTVRLNSRQLLPIMRLLRSASRISVWPGRRRWEIEPFCFQLILHFLNRAIKLLIYTFKFFSGIIINDDVRIDSMTLHYPLFAIFGIERELRLKELSAVDKR